MNVDDIQFLKSKVDSGIVKINFFDGEEMKAKILSVSENEQDVICNIISSNHGTKYTGRKGACLLHFSEIESVS